MTKLLEAEGLVQFVDEQGRMVWTTKEDYLTRFREEIHAEQSN